MRIYVYYLIPFFILFTTGLPVNSVYAKKINVKLANNKSVTARYVCYKKKSTDYYYGCTMSATSCIEKNLRYYDSYPTYKKTLAGYQQCLTGQTTDNTKNTKGNYVCYRYKEHSEDYSKVMYYQCQRQLRPCQQKELMHFGHYKNNASVIKALMRCQKGIQLK